MGLDEPGAASVNVTPGDKPRDIYTDVADKVEECRARDEAEGDLTAILLKGHITRKVCLCKR